ncbi:MAG: glycosyltransferase [Flavobacteriales bacterium]|nr:glycosyltransferase [Flavobacteriales bacterium]
MSSLEPLFKGVQEVMNELNYSFELIFVEDNGSNDSWEELLRLKKNHPDLIKIIRLSRNFGQNGATLCGIDEAIGSKIITLDDDLQTPPKEIKKLIEAQENDQADVVYGKQPDQNTSWLRRIGARIVKQIFNQNQGGSSVGSSFRLIDTHVADRLRFHSQDHLFINQVISWYTLNFKFVDVEHNSRKEGKSGYSLLTLISISFRLIFYYTSIPLKIVVFLCALFGLSASILGTYYLYQIVGLGQEEKIILFAIFGTIGLLLGSISIFGIYLNRIYSSRVKKPNYSIKVKH